MAPSVLQTPSIKSTNLRKRLSSFSLLASTLRRGRSQSSQSSAAVGYITPFRLRRESRSRSRSPSPEPSLEIRRPSGLGRRASVIDLLGELPEDELAPNSVYGHTRRKHSISTPELTLRPDGLLEWSHLPKAEENKPLPRLPEPARRTEPPPERQALSRLSSDLIKVVFSYASPADLASAALACKSLLEPVRALLYNRVDLLRVVDGSRVEKCVSLLASRRDLAGHVDHFACDITPASHEFGGRPTFSIVTFAIALNNMHKLTSLALPRFDSTLLFHSGFHLRELTFLCDHVSNDELRDTVQWLGLQPSLTSLSFPNLILSDDNSRLLAASSGQPSEDSHSTPSTTSLALPPTLLPSLARLSGPANMVAALVPRRPVASTSVHIHCTIYDGLRPSSLVSEIAKSSATISRFGLATSVHHKIDARTVERVLMSAGSAFGADVEVLEITTTLEDEVRGLSFLPILVLMNHAHAGFTQNYRRCLAAVPQSAYPSPSSTTVCTTIYASRYTIGRWSLSYPVFLAAPRAQPHTVQCYEHRAR